MVTVIDTLALDADADERKEQYLNADCFLICVAADSASPGDSVHKWKQEISSAMGSGDSEGREGKYIIMLALTKADLSNDEEGNAAASCIQESDLEELVQQMEERGSKV